MNNCVQHNQWKGKRAMKLKRQMLRATFFLFQSLLASPASPTSGPKTTLPACFFTAAYSIDKLTITYMSLSPGISEK
ncbi:hypothetical protein BT69DRAFT_680434 [Atractiella rhizophila]|nr:hypothetical protein BT69DRAFT_680434 [Atractiella rhizophila]